MDSQNNGSKYFSVVVFFFAKVCGCFNLFDLDDMNLSSREDKQYC